MRASKAVEMLTTLVAKHGDLEIAGFSDDACQEIERFVFHNGEPHEFLGGKSTIPHDIPEPHFEADYR